MAYNGPESGVLNIIPRIVSGTGVVLPSAPSVEVGSDGDFAFDMNTNTIYGPKDSTQTVAWPETGIGVGPKLLYRGLWASTNDYNVGDVVGGIGTSANTLFMCVKPVAYNATTWAAGVYAAGSFVNYSSQLYCAVIDAVGTDVPSGGSSVWKTADPYQDSTINYIYAGLGNWVALSGSVGVDTGFGTGSNKASRLVIPQNVLLNGSNPLNPKGIETGSSFPNYVIDSQSIESSGSLTTSLGNLSSGASDATLGGAGAGATVEIKAGGVVTSTIADAAVTNAKLYKVSGSEAVSTGAIRDAAVTDAKLSTTGVAAGNYPLVTVNTKGRVTAGTTLAATDITPHASRHGLLGADPVTGLTFYQLSIATATTAGVGPSDTQAQKIVSAGSTASSQPIAQASPTGGFSANKMQDLWADPFAHSRSSECSAMPRISAFSNLGLVSGNAYATRCVYTGNQASHTFSNIRCAVSAVGAGVTKFVLFVLDSTGTLVPNGYTSDTLGITAGAMTVGVVSGALNASIVLTPGAVYYLGVGLVFTTNPAPKGTSLGTGMTGIVPQLGRSGAYTTGAPASLSSLGSSASLPWVELY